MARELPVFKTPAVAQPTTTRKGDVRQGVWIELIAGGILLWRLLVEQRGESVECIEQAERRAAFVTAVSLFALAVYIVGDSALGFLMHTRPESSWWGVG